MYLKAQAVPESARPAQSPTHYDHTFDVWEDGADFFLIDEFGTRMTFHTFDDALRAGNATPAPSPDLSK